MNRQPVMILILIVTTVVVAASCAPQSTPTPVSATPAAGANLGNPASAFCEQKGFRLEIRTDATGGQAGICHFPDGSECDEWAYFRGECGPGQAAAAAAPTPTTPRRPAQLPPSRWRRPRQ